MGKLRDKKAKRAERRPLPSGGLPTVSEVNMMDDVEKLDDTEDKYPILTHLDSPHEEEREYACCSISHLVDSSEELEIIVQQGGIKKLMRNLIDTIPSIRVAAAGGLRNMSLVGGVDICEKMVEDDCMTPLISVLQQTAQSVISTESKTSEELEKLHQLLINLVALLINLSENSDRACSIVASSKSVVGLMYFLRKDVFPKELVILAAQLLTIITDENPPLSHQIATSTAHMQQLHSILTDTTSDIQLRAYVAGVLCNVSIAKTRLEILNVVLPFLSSMVEADILSLLAKLQPHFAEIALTSNSDDIQQKDPIYKPDMDNWNAHVKAQQFSLEVLTNIFSSGEAESEDISVPQEVLNFIATSGLIQKLLAKCSPAPMDVVEVLQKFNLPSIYQQLTVTQIRALHCIGNIFLILQPAAIGDVTPIWNFMCHLCNTNSPTSELLEVVTGVMWTIMRKFPLFEPIHAHIEGIVQLARSSSYEVRVNSIGILGILCQQPKMTGSLTDLGTLLLHSLSDNSIFVINESLNAIFDIFAETNHNDIVQKLEMLPKLLKCLQALRSKKQHLNTMEEDAALSLEEAEENLSRFMEYKYQQFK